MVDIVWSERHSAMCPLEIRVGHQHINGVRVATIIFDHGKLYRKWDDRRSRRWHPIEPIEAG